MISIITLGDLLQGIHENLKQFDATSAGGFLLHAIWPSRDHDENLSQVGNNV